LLLLVERDVCGPLPHPPLHPSTHCGPIIFSPFLYLICSPLVPSREARLLDELFHPLLIFPSTPIFRLSVVPPLRSLYFLFFSLCSLRCKVLLKKTKKGKKIAATEVRLPPQRHWLTSCTHLNVHLLSNLNPASPNFCPRPHRWQSFAHCTQFPVHSPPASSPFSPFPSAPTSRIMKRSALHLPSPACHFHHKTPPPHTRREFRFPILLQFPVRTSLRPPQES
jgi:hypothetical protein